MPEKMIVIGGTAAGLSAASKVKKIAPETEITVYEKSGYISYGACGLPYFVGGMIDDADELISLSVEDAANKRGIPAHILHEVTEIDRENRQVKVKELVTGKIFTDNYDKLIIASGASPVKLSVPGAEAENIYYLRSVEDGIRLKEAAKGNVKNAVIIGGGFIGLETAETLTNAGLSVTLLEALPVLCPQLPFLYSDEVRETLEANGVKVCTGAKVSAFEKNGNIASAVRTDDGNIYPAEIILCCVGVRPNSLLALGCGLDLGIKGAISVDRFMRTSDPGIWACGDCAETYHALKQKNDYIPLGTTANKQGRVAGSNAAGEAIPFAGVMGSMVTKVFDLFIAMTGLTPQEALDCDFEAADITVTQRDKASYYPGAKPAKLHLTFERGTGRLLGAQGIGSEAIAGRINTLAACITAKMSVADVNDLDLVYAPPVAPVYDPILIAASQAMKKV